MQTLKTVFAWTAWGAGFLAVAILSVPVTGLMIAKVWGWFVVPITGYREISISEGFGLTIFFAVAGWIATMHLKNYDTKHNADMTASTMAASELGRMAGAGIIGPLIGLASSWLWHTFFVAPPPNF